MVLFKDWITSQIDYTNAFAQADLKEEVYIEPHKGFLRKDKKDLVSCSLKSLYDLKQTPKSFFDEISDGLVERGFEQLKLD